MTTTQYIIQTLDFLISPFFSMFLLRFDGLVLIILSFYILKNKILILSSKQIQKLYVFLTCITILNFIQSLKRPIDFFIMLNVFITIALVYDIKEYARSFLSPLDVYDKEKYTFLKRNFYIILNINKYELNKIFNFDSQSIKTRHLPLNKVLIKSDTQLDTKTLYKNIKKLNKKSMYLMILYIFCGILFLILAHILDAYNIYPH